MNLKDLLQLAGEQGKVVVIDEAGDVKGVLLSFDEYKKVSGNEPRETVPTAEDMAEKVNREILQAQLEEVISSADAALPELPMHQPALDESVSYSSNAERIDSLISKRAQNLFKSMPYNYTAPPEVTTAAQVDSAIDEEIKPNFDDI